jgi:MoxR-like ATPase
LDSADDALSFSHMFKTPEDVGIGLREAGYAADPVLVQIIWLAMQMQKPILIEGPPGTGKTYLAQAFAAAAKTALIRLQCFEGITERQAIGSFDEALQRLFLETQAETLDRQWERIRLQLHTLDFFTEGPLLQAVLQPKPVVLLIDELDKVDQKFEALLLEILSDWQITIPKLGTVKAITIPFVVMTSNQERRLGDPLRRRSLYQRIEHPDIRKEAEVLDIRTVQAPLELKAQAVGLAQALRGYNLVKPPSIDEIVQFVKALQLLGRSEIQPEDRDVLLPFLAKTEEDVNRLLLRDGFSSLVATACEYRDQALAAMKMEATR